MVSPGQLASVYDEALHGLLGPRIVQAGDLIKFDVTAEKEGYVAGSDLNRASFSDKLKETDWSCSGTLRIGLDRRLQANAGRFKEIGCSPRFGGRDERSGYRIHRTHGDW
jgi:hypothetical protein